MSEDSSSQTSATLLQRLCVATPDGCAWSEFVTRYRPLIVRWCCARGLQGADAEDVAQMVLLRLTKVLSTFRYDPARSFRGWLKTVTRHTVSDLAANWPKEEGLSVERMARVLETTTARDDLESRLADLLNRELLELAMVRVQERVDASTWEAFRLTALEGRSGRDAAALVGIPVAHIFVARHRVQNLIRREVRILDTE